MKLIRVIHAMKYTLCRSWRVPVVIADIVHRQEDGSLVLLAQIAWVLVFLWLWLNKMHTIPRNVVAKLVAL